MTTTRLALFRRARVTLLALAIILFLPGPAAAQLRVRPPRATARTSAERPALVIESIELAGASRTSLAIVEAAAGLEAGAPADATAILAAAERLRQSGLFRTVEVHTRPGSEPGRVRVVFQVEENGPHMRFGLGYEDLSGWYLIPAQLNMDNLTGNGEAFALSTRFGYRLAGLVLSYKQPVWPSSNYWELRFRAEGQDWIYFLDNTEVIQKVNRGGVDVRVGRELPGPLSLETWVSFEKASADSTAEVYSDREVLDRESGDDIPFEVLPPSIQDDVDDRPQTRFGAALAFDTRKGSGLITRGLWGKGSVEAVVSSEEDFARLVGDFRTYTPVGGHALLAGRLRAGAVTSGAPFYERFYIGGLYTVRGYPSHALSPPQGDLNLATASVELRTAWVGPPSDPRVVGLVFADAGISWGSGEPDQDDGGAGVGYGFRVRIPWAGHLGIDVGRPLSPSPVDEAFHVNMSLGWTF